MRLHTPSQYNLFDAISDPVLGQGPVPIRLDSSERNGVVYTKSWVVDLLLDLAEYSVTEDLGAKRAIEPAAGHGAFVIAMAQRLIASCQARGRSITECGDALVAYEVEEQSAEVVRTSLTRLLCEVGELPSSAHDLVHTWVRTGDFLLDAPRLPKADFVIGNPPYIRLEDIPPSVASAYRRFYPTMVGRADLYVAFYEAALRRLKSDGVCAFICADRWMLNQYGAELRRLVTSSFSVETVVEMHRADAFDSEVSAYPAVTIFRHARQEIAVVASIDPDTFDVGKSKLAPVLKAIREDGAQHPLLPEGVYAARVSPWFSGTDPWPCASPDRLALLKRLEMEFLPLESDETKTVVGIGVATGCDEVFITRDAALVEGSRLLPLAMASDTKSGHLEWSGAYLVDPWQEDGLVDLRTFPRLAAYFSANEDRLRGRDVGKRNAKRWYRTIDRVNHALVQKPKLYIPDIKNRLTPVLDRGETYPHHNLYFVQSDGWDMEVLGGLLLSRVAQFFVECYGVRMRGGYLRFQAQYLRRIRVPRPEVISPDQVERLRCAFRAYDVEAATQVAFDLYGIDDPARAIFGY